MKNKEQGVRARRRRSQYASIPNALVRNKELSIEARMLMVYIMGCSESWVFYASVTMDVLGLGRDRYRKALRDLQKFGYLVIHPKQDPKTGRMSGQEWEIIDDPRDGENEPNSSAGAQDAPEQVENTAQDVVPGENNREPEIQAPGVQKNLASTGGLKNRQTVKPAGRDIDPLRRKTKKEEKQKRCAAEAPHETGIDFDDFFAEFVGVYPRMGDHESTEDALREALGAGADPKEILAGAKAYAVEQTGNKPRYIKYSENWVHEKRWKQHVTAPRETVDSRKVLEERAQDIRSRKPWARTILPSQAGECIVSGLVTVADCKAAGINV